MQFGKIRDLTVEQATEVRQMRCDDGFTWRMVACECFDRWGGDWYPPSNQGIGQDICQAAAACFGENPNAAPWN